MKKTLLFTFIFFSFTFNMFGKILSGGDSDMEMPEEDMTHIPAMIMVKDADIEETIADLESQGILVLYHRANLLLTYIPVNLGKEDDEDVPGDGEISDEDNTDIITKLRARGKIKQIEFSKPRRNIPLMKEARNFNNANLIGEGFDLPQPYDGKGIVVGVCDLGMDTRHPNFLNSDGTECRIRKVVDYKEFYGKRDEFLTPQQIYDWQTDNCDDWHATHVTGIAAGSHKESGYYSLAPEADIVFTSSMLSDVGLLAGVEDIISYAKEVNKPAVINLSMGNYVGPHDGSSLFTQYLDLCAQDAIICISAGNEGQGGMPRSASFDFTEEKKEYRIIPCDYGATDVAGEAEVWSQDNIPFTFAFYLSCNSGFAGRKDIFEDIVFPSEGTIEWRISANPDDPDYHEGFAEYYNEGYVLAKGGISPLNGRFFVNLQYELQTDIHHFSGSKEELWAEYWPAMKIIGDPGSHIDVYTGGNLLLHQEKGFPKPDNAMCISDLATGHLTISVGMMNSTDVTENAAEGSGLAKGDVSIYSGYGTLLDGRKLPMTCAPGAFIISSMSSPFLEAHPEEMQYVDDSSDYNGETVYWIGTLGTSMSCPFVVSAIATWLQAYPLLSSEEAIEIIQKTNQTSGFPNPEDPRHGQGWFNPYTGLQEVVNLAALKVGTVDEPAFTLKLVGNELIIGNPTGLPVTVEIYEPSGLLVKKNNFKGTTSTYNLSDLPKGVYIIKTTGYDGKVKTIKYFL